MANMAGRRNKNAFTFVLKLLIISQIQILGVYDVVWGGLDQSSRKRRITRIGTHIFSLGRKIFARQEFRVRMFF